MYIFKKQGVSRMAQLVKLQDYISRYQIDITRYPTQFVRLKKSQWEKTKLEWQSGEMMTKWEHLEIEQQEQEEQEPKTKLSILKRLIPLRFSKQGEQEEENIEQMDVSNEFVDDEWQEEDTSLLFNPNIVYTPRSLEELKRIFLDQFFQFQLKWASSTLREKSYVDPKFMRDHLLRTFLQSLPDSYMLFYYPVLRLKKAPIELEIVLMTPTECYIIKVLEEGDQAVYVASGDRFWTKKVGKIEKKLLNPMIDLDRSATIVQQLMQQEGAELPIRKVLLSRNGYFDYPGSSYDVRFVDKRKFPEWFQQMRRSISPMKHMQIKAAQSLLNVAETTSFNRDIWQVDKETQNMQEQDRK